MLKWLKKSQAGQAMVEMALVLPVLIILLGGILDFGWLYYNKIALTNAAREGARYAAIHYTTAPERKQESIDLSLDTYVGPGNASADVYKAGASQIVATVSADIPILTGVASTILGEDSIYMTGECIMRIEI